MRKLDSRLVKAAWPIAAFMVLLAWGACSDNGVSASDGSLCSSDSLCKGALRTLTTGQWWEEIQFDTLVSTRDSGRVSITRTVHNEHHRHSEVVSVMTQGGDLFYHIQTRDTLLRPGNPRGDSLSIDNVVLRHNDTLVEYSIPTNNAMLDTLKYAALKLPPLANGGSWTILSKVVDSTMRLQVSPAFSFPVLYHLGIQSKGTYGANGSSTFGGKAYATRNVNRATDFTVAIKSDTVLVFIDTLARVGDTIAVSTSHTDQDEVFNFDLSAAFSSRETEIKLDSNYIDSTSTRENNIKVKTLTRYSDPRRILTN